MGFVPLPRPLTKEEFDKAYNNGARTMREIDPQLGEWADMMNRQTKYQIAALCSVPVGVIIIICFRLFG